MKVMKKVADFVGKWFAVLVLVGAVVGLLIPAQTSLIAPTCPCCSGSSCSAWA